MSDDDKDVTFFDVDVFFTIKDDVAETMPPGGVPIHDLDRAFFVRAGLAWPGALDTIELLRCIETPCAMCSGDSGDMTIECPCHYPEEGSMPGPWPTMQAFYADRGGLRSGETDYGVWWWDGTPAQGEPSRVSWVHDTGDVYAIRQRSGVVRLLGTIPTAEQTERALDGWADVCGTTASMEWVRTRMLLHPASR